MEPGSGSISKWSGGFWTWFLCCKQLLTEISSGDLETDSWWTTLHHLHFCNLNRKQLFHGQLALYLLSMDRSGFPLSSAHRAPELDTCTSTPNDILHNSAAHAKYTRTHDRVCPTTIIAVIGQMGGRAQFDWQAGSVLYLVSIFWCNVDPGS